jgi:hypothetical protein
MPDSDRHSGHRAGPRPAFRQASNGSLIGMHRPEAGQLKKYKKAGPVSEPAFSISFRCLISGR